MSGLIIALALGACAPQAAKLPSSPVPAGPGIRVVAEAVPQATGAIPADNFAYAGGVWLTSADTSRLHGLSDLVIRPDGRLIAISDEGDLVKGRLVLDGSGRLTGVADMTLASILDVDGRPLSGRKADADTEGLALWPNGDLMISFEGKDRILLYPAAGGPPRTIPIPDTAFPSNDGMEALSVDPASGPDAYLVGREDTRETWTCRLAGGCVPRFKVGQDGEGKLVSARPMPKGGWVFLLRDFNPAAGSVIRIVVTDPAGRLIDTHVMKRPATVDNFEGIAPIALKDGRVRLYIVSDDNFQSIQRTLLLAFDWTPPKGR